MTKSPTIRPQVWAEILAVSALSVLIALFGDPRPFALLVAGAGGLTAAYIGAKDLDR
jgi:uncharacterized membrane protein YfcA